MQVHLTTRQMNARVYENEDKREEKEKEEGELEDCRTVRKRERREKGRMGQRKKDGLDDWTRQVVPRPIGSAILDSDKRDDPPGPERRVSVKTGRRERKAMCTR
ncbi:hypothetical protein MAP00_001046 [Monascus purpureus]|nr:hypothetical protein MAP00_001046 [Monascus purpureus]